MSRESSSPTSKASRRREAATPPKPLAPWKLWSAALATRIEQAARLLPKDLLGAIQFEIESRSAGCAEFYLDLCGPETCLLPGRASNFRTLVRSSDPEMERLLDLDAPLDGALRVFGDVEPLRRFFGALDATAPAGNWLELRGAR